MAPKVDPVHSDEVLPARADVVIIGGGIIGTSTALFLAQKGIRTVLCEKGHIAGEQSSRNWGWCRKMGRDPRESPLIIESLRLWAGMNELVEAETGFRQAGIMYLAENQAELGQLEGWLEHARQYQLDTRILTRAEAAELMPGLTGNWTGALYTASDGKAEPPRAAPAIAEAARKSRHREGSSGFASGWTAATPSRPSGSGRSTSCPITFGCSSIIFPLRGCTERNCGSASAAAGSRNGAPRGVGVWTRHRRS